MRLQIFEDGKLLNEPGGPDDSKFNLPPGTELKNCTKLINEYLEDKLRKKLIPEFSSPLSSENEVALKIEGLPNSAMKYKAKLVS